MPDCANRERDIFNAALERASTAEREAFLDGACGSDVELRARLDALLHASDAAGGFLSAKKTSELSRATDAAEAPIREGPGTRIGRYKLLERIGEGGFGVVYMAEQEEPVRRRVALKIVKLGMDTRAVVARFEAERQALAMMDHPNIAKVLDGGATDTGRPYFVMELVRGVRITTFCNEQRLTTHERIELFMRVCHAVQHAHQKGVIHRDLKPSNILVTMHDDRPVPKVIDFGIAKATELRLTEKTLFTRFHQFVGTPSYMSPEQTGISGLDVDTRSDIYSLGVLLYELLTDRTPFDMKALLDAGYEEIHRAIREKEPPSPSHRLASLSREEQTTAAQRRRLDPVTLTSELRGDLDLIVLKCLEKDRVRRYETASGLAADLARHLNHEPVVARPPSASYRMGKFVRRHRVPVAFAGLIFAALLIGLAGTMTQARRATRHAALADEERRRADDAAGVASEGRDFALRQLSRAEAINELNAFLLSDAAPSGKPFTVGELLARAERIMDREYADTDENRVEILIALGRQYQAQDEDGKAREVLAKAHALARNVSDLSVRAKAASALASAISRIGEFERAESLIQEALTELGDKPQFALHRVFCLLCGREVAALSRKDQLAIERMQLAQRILNESRQGSALLNLRVSMNLAESYRSAGRNREAAMAFNEAFSRLTALGRGETNRACVLLNNWALALHSLGHPLEAERKFRRAITIARADESEKGVSPMLLNNLARTLGALHRFSEAADYADRAYTTAQSLGEKIVVNHSLRTRATIYIAQGELDRAAAVISELESMLQQTAPVAPISLAMVASLRSTLALARADHETALAEAKRVITTIEATGRYLDILSTQLLDRADINLKMRHFEAARADAQRALAIEQQLVEPPGVSSRIGRAHLTLARALHAQETHDEARTAFVSALKHLLPTLGTDHPATREAAQGIGTPR